MTTIPNGIRQNFYFICQKNLNVGIYVFKLMILMLFRREIFLSLANENMLANRDLSLPEKKSQRSFE